MNDDLKAAIQKGQLVLFLGAGASRGCKSKSGQGLLDGAGLAKALAFEAGLPYSGEALDIVYSAARAKLASRLNSVLDQMFRHCTPSPEYRTLAKFAWRRIYTLNIDDALERALHKDSRQFISVRIGSDQVEDRDQFFERLDVIKLNGCVQRINSGIIFSPPEYAQATTSQMPWYEESAIDFLQSPFLFIGTKLEEPLLKFHIERYKSLKRSSPGISYLITPTISEIQRLDLSHYNIIHLPGTLTDFSDWLVQTIAPPPGPIDLAKEAIPQLAALLGDKNRHGYASLFEGVTHVTRSNIGALRSQAGPMAIRTFYKGFRPTWDDIADEIPARLDSLTSFMTFLKSNTKVGRLVPIVGPSGSGKTTVLMQAAFSLSMESDTEVYYIGDPIAYADRTIEAIDRTSSATRCVVALDNLDFFSDQLRDLFAAKRLSKTIIIGTERQNIWNKRTKHKLGSSSSAVFHVKEFSVNDVPKILEKLQKYGQWTRLGQMSEKQRRIELVDRAKRQLLIALLEATSGRGYEDIITSEYQSLSSDSERLLFLLAGLATVHRCDLSRGLAERALLKAGVIGEMPRLLSSLSGIVHEDQGKLAVRHPTYVRFLLTHVIDPLLVHRGITALLKAFSLYPSPVIKHVSKLDATVYKAITNHKFLFEVLKGNKELVLQVYRSFEKSFELDGLYWLHYGLSLRDFNMQAEALEKLRTAREAFPMDHTQHALAQQLLIIGPLLNEKERAYAYLEEAREMLTGLDNVIESDDTYPLVTLAEGHVKVVRHYEGDGAARAMAAKYATELKHRSDRFPDEHRLRESWERLFRYGATGTWVNNELDQRNLEDEG